MKLKQGDILLYRKNPSNFISRAIAMATGSSYSHVGILSSQNDDSTVVAEALDKGFTLTRNNTIEYMQRIEDGDVLVLRSKEPLEFIKEYILKYLGRPYGFFDIFAILIYTFTKKMVFKGTANRLICSEAVARILYDASNKKIDFSKEYNKPYSYITPDDIFMSKHLKRVL